jgi:hypothetical protein
VQFQIKWINPSDEKVSYSKKMSENEAIKWCARMNAQWPERKHVVIKYAAPGREG